MISIIGKSPSDGSKNNSIDSSIFFILKDSDGVKLLSLIVKVNGQVAILNGNLQQGFSTSSEITFVDNDLNVTLVKDGGFSLNDQILVDVTCSNIKNKKINEKYSFFAQKNYPIISETNTSSKITEHSLVYIKFLDYNYNIDSSSLSITIDEEKVITSGSFESFFDTSNSKIEEESGYIEIYIDHPEFFRNRAYNMYYSISNDQGYKNSGFINFEIDVKKIIYPNAFPPSSFIGFIKGIKQATSLGSGGYIEVESPEITSRSNKSEVFYLIYYAKSNKSFFDILPKAITSSEKIVIENLDVGSQYYWGVRCLEAYKGTFDFSGMTEVDSGYKIPEEVSLSSNLASDESIIYVDSVFGYPSSGLLVINDVEVVKYSSINTTDNYFVLASGGRGLNNTSASSFVSGEKVKLFLKCQDSNNNIIASTPTYEDGYQHDRSLNNVGFVVTDYTDQDLKFFQGFDFCGYHRPLPDRVLQGIDDCGSYLGGEFNGSRGFNIYDRMINREEVLLDQTGEPVVLLKRKWSGVTCDCSNARRSHPKMRSCNKCYGTGYVGGYDQYFWKRRQDRMIMMSFPDTVEDLKLDPKSHLEQVYEPQCWTLPVPTIRDRDILVRFDFTGDQEFYYEVLNVSREKIMYKHFGRQRVTLKRLDKTDIVYHFKYITI